MPLVGVVRALACTGVAALVTALALAPKPASADLPSPMAPPCDAWEIEYAISANLELTNTTMNQGDGIYPVGPGTMVLRFDDQGGRPGGHVKMLSYAMQQSIRVVSKALFWTTTVVTDTMSRAAPDSCGIVASGLLTGPTLAWSSPIRNVRSDGAITCGGALCGKFGAPPSGRSEFHLGPNSLTFQPFQFGDDLKTFTMASTFVSQTEQPKHTAHMAFAGRETRRSCVQVKDCS